MTSLATPLITDRHYFQLVDIAKKLEPTTYNSTLCAPRVGCMFEREADDDLRILFIGQCAQHNEWHTDKSEASAFQAELTASGEEIENNIKGSTQSKFWQGIRAILCDTFDMSRWHGKSNPRIAHCVGWTNILKVSPKQNNPTGKELNRFVAVQNEVGIELLKHELNTAVQHKCDAVIFLTHNFCWNEIIEKVLIPAPDFHQDGKIGIGKYATEAGEVPIIFSRHPCRGPFWSNHLPDIVKELQRVILPERREKLRKKLLRST